MKKSLFIALIIAFAIQFSCEKEDDIQVVKMRINHYQQPVNQPEFYYGLSYKVQEGKQIGKGEWFGFLNTISGFEYELGYVYDIEVQKKQIEDPMIDMPSVEYSLIRIISKTQVVQEITFDITLSIEYSNGFESYLIKNNQLEFTLLGDTKIDCGELCDELEESIINQKGMVGTFKHVGNEKIGLLRLDVQ
ncbi:DUF4377 domain-containing protein [Labilibacter sediminis]|nr:DUF4377 domain-containing protein [Labilibacter sediminis]